MIFLEKQNGSGEGVLLNRQKEIRKEREADQLAALTGTLVACENTAKRIQDFIDEVKKAGIKTPVEVYKLLEEEIDTLKALAKELEGDVEKMRQT
ncbi:conserved hypothetical protein [Heliomicrobium modesticaldum Ice1]|uniref:Uncharacterized protein n=1 Tax=Heliobacterium modesticaldum (strain ATCC 51547 / Ice1) TaxID=498761 RepID=B0TAH6_HELMI|nr:hypothetical protein [Heliomicrobium modesticaldum]ABZ85026.1 conserved hypothetical protein [Heliomicrobium modesticaldum Ice1]